MEAEARPDVIEFYSGLKGQTLMVRVELRGFEPLTS